MKKVKMKKYYLNGEIIKVQKGITLIGLVVTIIVLLILAGISINTVLGENGIIKRTQESHEKYKIAEARDKLEVELLNAKIEKQVNSEYNQNEFLDSLILENIKDSKIIGDIVVVDGYAFNLDRSVPKIGGYAGKEDELVFPKLTTNIQTAEDFKSATITIATKEEKNGINKIEIIQNGFVIKEYTYEDIKDEITENFIVKQNGKYIIKVYSKLSITQIQNITNLVASIKYTPNGNKEYKKEHSVKISITESPEKVNSIKYQWLQTTVEPDSSTFTETVNDGETITKNGITGEWYLWIMLTTETGKININRSEVFYFDNEAPTITTFKATEYSITGITLSATVQDTKSGVIKFEFYLDDELKATETCEATTSSITKSTTITDASTGSHTCKVIVYDELNNSASKTASGTTKMHTWARYSVNETTTYNLVKGAAKPVDIANQCINTYNSYEFNSSTGTIIGVGTKRKRSILESNSGMGPLGHYCISAKCMRYYCQLINRSNTWTYARWNVIDYTVVAGNTSYSKGSTQYNDVTSTNSSTYPSNGKSGDYWYVYQGVK